MPPTPPPAPPPAPPDYLAELYGITFTPHELKLLTADDPELLSPIDRQRQYLLRVALTPVPCPACGGISCRRAACTLDYDTTPSIPDDAYACQICDARLIWRLALFGGEQSFALAPGQTVTITRG